MRRGADVVVIGGGVNGCSTAYHLARMGCRNVVVVEKDQVASGASGRCPGGFRHQWGTRANILLMAASIRMFTQLQQELDFPGDLEVRQNGYLFLAYTEQGMEQFKANARLQQSLGIPVELLEPSQARELVPRLVADGLLGGSFCPWDGRANPFLVTHAYARAAIRLGVEINTDTTVIGLTTSDAGITGVVTDRGMIETSRVVCVAGAHSTGIASMVGVDLPIHPLRRQAIVTERVGQSGWPVLMSLHHGVSCFQARDGGLIAGIGSPWDVKEFDVTHSRQSAVRAAKGWAQLAPVLGEIRVLRSWGGLYDMSPDAHPIMGPVPGVEGFHVAAGFSGHGFMMGPITGKVMAETILGQPISVDISRLEVGRFERGDLVIEPMVK